MRLPGRQLGVEDQHPGVHLHRPHQHVLQLAPADQVLGIGHGPPLLHHVADHDARRPAQLAQLGHPALHRHPDVVLSARSARLAPGADHDQQRPLGALGGDGGGDRALELLLQRGHQVGRVHLGLVERDGRHHRPGHAVGGGRRHVGQVQVGRAPVPGHPHRRHQVQPQQRQVDQVVPGQRLVAQVGVHQPQAPEPPPAGAQAPELGDVDARGITDEYVFDLAPPADQHPHLPLQLPGQPTHVARQLVRQHLAGVDPPPVDALQRLGLAGLQAAEVAG